MDEVKKLISVGGLRRGLLPYAIPTIIFFVFLLVMYYLFDQIVTGGVSSYASVNGMVWLLLVSSALGLMWCVLRTNGSLANLLVFYFCGVSVAYIAVLNDVRGLFPWPVKHSEHDETGAALIFICFMVAYLAGVFIRIMLKRAGAVNRRPPDPLVPNRLVLFTFVAMTLLSMFLVVYNADMVFHPRTDVNDEFDNVSLGMFKIYGFMIGKSLTLTTMLVAASFYHNLEKTDKRKTLWLAIYLFFIAYGAVWFNPVSNPRFQFIAYVFTLVVINFKQMTSVLRATALLGLALANFFLFAQLKMISTLFSAKAGPVMASTDLDQYVFRVDFDSFQCSAVGFAYTNHTGFLYFKNIIGAILFFVPRPLWPDKPMPTPIAAFEYFSYEYANVSYPLPMEFYTAGGYLAVALLSFGAGYFISSLEQTEAQNVKFKQTSMNTIMLAIVTAYMPIFMRGSLNSVAPMMGFAFIAAAIYKFVYVVQRKKRGRA